jgi:hypothetical protein
MEAKIPKDNHKFIPNHVTEEAAERSRKALEDLNFEERASHIGKESWRYYDEE